MLAQVSVESKCTSNCETVIGRLDVPELGSQTGAEGVSRRRESSCLAGTPHLGEFRLLKKIATGGMSDIWLAVQVSSRGAVRSAAVKQIVPSLSRDAVFAERFSREMRVAKETHHPSVVPVYEVGFDRGTFFVASAWVCGPSLADVSARAGNLKRAIPLPIAAEIASDVLGALHAIHGLGAVHLDVSPSSIMAGYDGRVQLTDIGPGKAVARISRGSRWFNVGKARYRSPEHADSRSGAAANVDGRADVYAVGVILWELCTGIRFQQGRPRPSDHNPAVPPELDDVILRAIATDPPDRFQTAILFRQALEPFIADAPRSKVASESVDGFVRGLFLDRLDQQVDLSQQVRTLFSTPETGDTPFAEDWEHCDPYTETLFDASKTSLRPIPFRRSVRRSVPERAAATEVTHLPVVRCPVMSSATRIVRKPGFLSRLLAKIYPNIVHG